MTGFCRMHITSVYLVIGLHVDLKDGLVSFTCPAQATGPSAIVEDIKAPATDITSIDFLRAGRIIGLGQDSKVTSDVL